ncbi:Hypothetical protein A7982_09327 [Minicystis rosea]|nr:Hypothetical protein A7982_09327 [Minicystis rosea]
MAIVRACFLGALLVAGSGCGWTHAKGYEKRTALPASTIKVKTFQMCSSAGTCTHEGRRGPLVATETDRPAITGLRSNWAFRVVYDGRDLACRYPAEVEGKPVALACEQVAGPGRVAIVVDAGCREGQLWIEQKKYRLSFDRGRVGGTSVPGREVAILDERGELVAFIDYPSLDFTMYGPAEAHAELTTPIELVAGAMGMFLQSGSAPMQCIGEAQ